MIVVGSQNDVFAHTGKSLASSSNCSHFEETVIPKAIEKTIPLYPTDANEVQILVKKCKITTSSGLDGLSNKFLEMLDQ